MILASTVAFLQAIRFPRVGPIYSCILIVDSWDTPPLKEKTAQLYLKGRAIKPPAPPIRLPRFAWSCSNAFSSFLLIPNATLPIIVYIGVAFCT
jgi:hypothetical protein